MNDLMSVLEQIIAEGEGRELTPPPFQRMPAGTFDSLPKEEQLTILKAIFQLQSPKELQEFCARMSAPIRRCALSGPAGARSPL